MRLEQRGDKAGRRDAPACSLRRALLALERRGVARASLRQLRRCEHVCVRVLLATLLCSIVAVSTGHDLASLRWSGSGGGRRLQLLRGGGAFAASGRRRGWRRL